MQQISINKYETWRTFRETPMTLIMGARCADGTVLVADRNMSSGVGSDIGYANKITGEIKGVLTAFSGDRGTFELFRNRLRNYVKTLEEQRKERRDKRNRNKFRGDVDEVLWQIHEIKNALLRYNLDVMVAFSSMYFRDKKSILYFFYHDWGYIPVEQYGAIGSGEPFSSYYLKRYWQKNILLKEFAQLGDFIIRLVENRKYMLDNNVGLDPDYPYPQIVYIPDNRADCRKYNSGQAKSDCSPTQQELEEFKTHSEKKLEHLYSLAF